MVNLVRLQSLESRTGICLPSSNSSRIGPGPKLPLSCDCARIMSCNRRAPTSTRGHRDMGMVDIVSRHCQDPSCTTRPLYNMKGLRPMLCRAHKLPEMIDVISSRCQEPVRYRLKLRLVHAIFQEHRSLLRHFFYFMLGVGTGRRPHPAVSLHSCKSILRLVMRHDEVKRTAQHKYIVWCVV